MKKHWSPTNIRNQYATCNDSKEVQIQTTTTESLVLIWKIKTNLNRLTRDQKGKALARVLAENLINREAQRVLEA